LFQTKVGLDVSVVELGMLGCCFGMIADMQCTALSPTSYAADGPCENGFYSSVTNGGLEVWVLGSIMKDLFNSSM